MSRSHFNSGERKTARQLSNSITDSVDTDDIRSEETTERFGGNVNQSDADYLELGSLRGEEQDRDAERDSVTKHRKSTQKMTREDALMLRQILKKKH